MILHLKNVLTPLQLQMFSDLLTDDSRFEDGGATAGTQAVRVKRNLQAKGGPISHGLERKLRDQLLRDSRFQSAARPKDIVKMLFSRYEPGMSYGSHLDNALMSGQRTDLSFTLFLSPPDLYEGGELVMESNGGEQAFKLPAGDLILYSTALPHRVNEVRSGVRLAAVGWVRSYLRDPGEREIVFDLDRAIAALEAEGADERVILDLAKVRGNLLRRWVED